jgi:predicted molibdopterin-dependent oxidoreductase YjgC
LIDGVKRPASIQIVVNGRSLSCYPGETVATALLAGGVRIFRRTSGGQGRAPVCNMGVCFDCLVTIDGKANQRACMTRVLDGMQVEAAGDE